MSRRAVPSRVSPHPVSSGISFQALPPATIAEVEKLCDYHVEQCTGRYAGPVSRHLFDLSNEVKSLLAPLQAEDAKKQSRLAYLEALLLQWEEVFGRGGMGGLHLPAGAFEEPPMGGQIRSAVKGLQHGLQLQGGTSRGRASPQQHLEVRVRRRGPIGGGSNSNRRPPRGRSPGTLSFATTPTPRQGRGAKPGATGGSTTRRGRSKDRLESELSVIRANSPSPERPPMHIG